MTDYKKAKLGTKITLKCNSYSTIVVHTEKEPFYFCRITVVHTAIAIHAWPKVLKLIGKL